MSAWTCECGTVYDTDFRFDCPKCGRRFDSLEDDEMVKPDGITSGTMTEEQSRKLNEVIHINEMITDVANELGTEGRYEDERITVTATDHTLIVWIKDGNSSLKVWHDNQIRRKGRWCLYLERLAKKAKAARKARQDEADKKQREEEERCFGPVDDAALFPEFAEPAKPESDPNYRPPPPKPAMVDGFPRRGRVDLWCPAEKAIQAAVDAVEESGADLLLTDAVILLGQAQDKVADWYESQPKKD